ncbi:MAG: T9SS type A sorting domain-containing protein [Flavobacteriales bacterium]|nr:T9SS type A sorting domain-containing protein [Flavobacteriales bacterium]
MKLTRTIIYSILGLSLTCSFTGYSQLNVTTVNTDYTINFDATVPNVNVGAFDGSGLFPFPAAGKLNSNAWEILGMSDPGGTYGGFWNSGDYARGIVVSTNPTTGGIYAYSGGGPTGRALGIQPTDLDMTPGSIELRCINNTGQIIHTVDLDYELFYRNWSINAPNDRANTFNGILRTENMGTYTDLTGGQVGPATLQFTSPGMRTNTTLVQVPMTYSFSGVAIEPGEYFYIRWETDDFSGGGDRDEFVIDDIVINVQATDSLVFYTQNTGVQSSTVGSSTTVQWSTLPVGNVTYRMFPFQDSSSLIIQSPHIVEYIGAGSGATFKNLIVENGAQLMSDDDGFTGFLRYLYLHGDITCDGEIGNGAGTNVGTGIGFDFEPGSHSIKGTGTFNCARIRKSNVNSLAGVCDLTFDMDVSIHWNANGLYNDRPNLDGGSNHFNIIISPGVTVNVMGDMGIDGSNPISGFHNAGGSVWVGGTLNVADAYYLMTNNGNPLVPVSITVASGGVFDVGYFASNGSGNAGHTLIAEPNSLIEISDRSAGGQTWLNNSFTNNSFDLQPNSTIRYSMANNQPVLQGLSYENLIVTGSGFKSVLPASGDLVVHGDLTIGGSAVLNPNNQDLVVSGSWTNYLEGGFTDPGVEVLFDNATGNTTISCGGTELFDHVIFGSNCGTEVTNTRTYENDWQRGDGNNGFFGNWELNVTSGDENENGHFIGDSTTNGDGDNTGDGDLGNNVISVYANNGNTASAVLPFTQSMSTGSSFSIQMDNGGIDPGGTVGFGLQNASDENLWEFYFLGGDASYTVNASGGPSATTLPYTDEGLSVDISMTGPNTFDVTVTLFDGGATWTGSSTLINPPGGQIPSQLRVFNYNAGAGTPNDTYFNYITLCHGPGTIDLNTDVDGYGPMELYCRVNLNGNDVLFRNPPLTLGPNEESYFVSEDILHQGTISASINSYSLPVTFPFGTDDDIPIYTEFDLNSGNAGVVTMATYRTPANNLPWPSAPTAVNNLNSTTGLLPDNRDATADRFWSITSTNSVFDANMTLSITDSELPISPYDSPISLVAQRYDENIASGSWRPPLIGQSSVGGTFSANTISVFVPNVTQLSPWAVASIPSPLPVELLSFEGDAVKEGIELTWSTATEVNNSGFALRRFTESQIEKEIAFIPGNGNSSAPLEYRHIDPEPEYGWNYYRLFQYDYDGTIHDEGLVSVWWDGESADQGYEYQWVNGGLLIQNMHDRSLGDISLYDATGKLLYSQREADSRCLIPIPRTGGVYILHLLQEGKHFTERLVDIRP